MVLMASSYEGHTGGKGTFTREMCQKEKENSGKNHPPLMHAM